MTEIRLWNTKTKTRDVFTPIDPTNVRMYVCGPTVYDRAHLGNARPVVVFDVLFRLLRHVYGAENVTYVRNITDIDDKINATAQARKAAGAEGTLEHLIHERADETIHWYHQDMDALGALRPSVEPRATQHIGTMIAMIQSLIEKGHAYVAEGHVLFAVESYADYGHLSGRSVEDMIAGARVEVAPFKRNPMDFVLWKPSDDDLPGWDSPWGRGRPGWHIECSAMSFEILGGSFDIHGGGIDLQFPHHENEIAQSTCAHPSEDFARVWMHNEMLQVEGKKMSKSLGNFFTVRELLDSGVPGEVIRFVFLSTHYRKPMDWTERKRKEAEVHLDSLARGLELALRFDRPPSGKFTDLPHGMQITLSNDLDTHGALQVLIEQARLVRGMADGETVGGDAEAQAVAFLTGLEVLGLYDLVLKRQEALKGWRSLLDPIELDMTLSYNLARQTLDFSRIDAMKAALAEAGVEVRMSKEGVELFPAEGFDPAKLEALG